LANHQDAIKRNKQNERRRIHNRSYRTRMRNSIKKVRTLIENGDLPAAKTALNDAMAVIHRVAGKGIIHKNQAARRISRLVAAVKKAEGANA